MCPILSNNEEDTSCFNLARAAVVHLNFRAGSTFPVPVCTIPSSSLGLGGATRLTWSDFMLHKTEFTLTKGADLRARKVINFTTFFIVIVA